MTTTLPTFTFDLREHDEFDSKFGDLAVADDAFRCMDSEPPLDASAIEWSPLDEFIADEDWDDVVAILSGGHSDTPMVRAGDPNDITDDRKAELNDRYNLDELDQPFRDALSWAYERALMVTDEDIEHELREAVEAQGTEMYGVLTDGYWCGALASWPWADICTDEDAVIEQVLKRAKVKGSKLTLTYAGTPWARRLLAFARENEVDRETGTVDYGFGGNSEMELGVMARYVFNGAVERLNKMRWDRVEHGVDVKADDLRTLLREFFREA